eukprot:Skav202237  [mRNA]  locus=scaffold2988:192962:202508:+ [translate_table: standard]
MWPQAGGGSETVDTSEEEQNSWSASDQEAGEGFGRDGREDREALRPPHGALVVWVYQLWEDIEWARDGDDGKLYIVQARPETVASQKKVARPLRRAELWVSALVAERRGEDPGEHFDQHRSDGRVRAGIMMNVGNPETAFAFGQLPNEGIGLARLEFVASAAPCSLLNYDTLDAETKDLVDERMKGYKDPKDSWRYKSLIGGEQYEPDEENPMIGFRGCGRYTDPFFEECFAMELEAMGETDLKGHAVKMVRGEMGLKNVEIMIPFVRTLDMAKDVNEVLEPWRSRGDLQAVWDGNCRLLLSSKSALLLNSSLRCSIRQLLTDVLCCKCTHSPFVPGHHLASSQRLSFERLSDQSL